jgi:predicted nucleic acid-binding protein
VRFLDTNILLYAISRDPAEQRKTRIALDLLDATDLGLSVQVLQEFYVQATRHSRSGALPHDLALQYLEHWQALAVQDLTLDVVRAALASCQRFGISYWDAAIVEAARALGCRSVLSEDLQHGASYGGVRVQNPFRGR